MGIWVGVGVGVCVWVGVGVGIGVAVSVAACTTTGVGLAGGAVTVGAGSGSPHAAATNNDKSAAASREKRTRPAEHTLSTGALAKCSATRILWMLRSSIGRNSGYWCRGAESNRRHHDFQSCALPTELPRPEWLCGVGIHQSSKFYAQHQSVSRGQFRQQRSGGQMSPKCAGRSVFRALSGPATSRSINRMRLSPNDVAGSINTARFSRFPAHLGTGFYQSSGARDLRPVERPVEGKMYRR